MIYNKSEYLIVRVNHQSSCQPTSTIEIMKVTGFDEKTRIYSILSSDGTNHQISEDSLKGNSYQLDLNPDFLIRLADRKQTVAGQKKDEHYLLYDFSLPDQTPITIHVYVEGNAVYYYLDTFDEVSTRIRINTFEDFQRVVKDNLNIEMLFEIEAISKAYGKIGDPLINQMSRLFDCSSDYEQCKKCQKNNTDPSKAKEIADKTDAAKERFLSICRSIDFNYKGTPDKSPILQELYKKMIVVHQGHFGTVFYK